MPSFLYLMQGAADAFHGAIGSGKRRGYTSEYGLGTIRPRTGNWSSCGGEDAGNGCGCSDLAQPFDGTGPGEYLVEAANAGGSSGTGGAHSRPGAGDFRWGGAGQQTVWRSSVAAFCAAL